MMPVQRILAIVLLANMFFVPCSAFGQENNEEKAQGYTFTFPAMGSTFHVAAYCEDEAKLATISQAIEKEVQRLNLIFSDYDPASELEKLLASEEPQAVPLSDDLFRLLQLSEEWHHKTSGAFDPAIGQLTHLWRARRRAGELPSEQQIASAKQHSGWSLVKLDSERKSLSFLDEEVQLDFGGIATGYTVDRCYQILVDGGITSCLINSGGDIRCGQAPPGREGWRIEVAPIEKGKEALKYLTVRNCAITTSGDLWRYVDVDGVRRSHIIDPKTGYGIPGPTAVTVVSNTCLEVDVLGTALSVMGPAEGLNYLQTNFPDAAAYFVWKDQGSDELKQMATPDFDTSGHR